MKKLLNSPNLYYFFFLPILIGLALIWGALENRPLHHDESLNAIYSLYYYLDPASGHYKYNPMLHGPLLYNIVPWALHLFGESHFSLRLIPAIIFSFLPLGIGFLLWKKIGKMTFLLAALLLTGSSYAYWATFLRHDQLVLGLLLLSVLSFHNKLEKYQPYILFPALALQFCAKENAYVHLSMLLGFIIFFSLINRDLPSFLKKLLSHKWHLFSAFLISLFLYCYLYSSGFRYSQGILDGLYRKSLSYWLNQHSIERISGPFLTQFFTLLWYELPFIILLLFSVFKIHWDKGRAFRFLPLILLMIGGGFHLSYGAFIPAESLWRSVAKLQLGIDFYGFFLLIALSISGTWILLKEKRSLLAFSYYWVMASFFTYSYVGEKVPWLSVYILISGFIFLGLYYKEVKPNLVIPIGLIFCLFNLYQSHELLYTNPGADTEFISQVHTSEDYEELALNLQSFLENKKGSVLILRENTWPLTWFLYQRSGFSYHHENKDFSNFDFILDQYPGAREIQGFQKKVLPLRHWWVPDYKQINLLKALKYSFDHRPWNPTGRQKVTLFYKEGLLDF